MKIEELVIEGFKSYPTRTTIQGWDPSFNAITGLNGTGKSNILDAISFVLGLTDYKELRASNWQELIYKKGAAGVTKASVTIVFNNSDPASGPPGMQQYKQITVTRQIAIPNKSKYLVNGHVMQQQHVQTLFQSVQLNINNPNFVIRQGKITKVLNMGPREILGLIEEASGTRMYEEKKEKALRTISKKEKKVEDIESLLEEEINPKLDRLRKEKESYIAYTKAVSESERLGRVVSAFQYTDYNGRIRQRRQEIDTQTQQKADLERARKDRSKEKSRAEAEAEEVARKRDEEMQKDGKMKMLEEEMAKHEKEVAKVQAQVEIVEGVIEENRRTVEEVQQALTKTNESLEDARTTLAEKSVAFGMAKDAHAAAQQSLTTAEELQQTLSAGLTSGNTSGGYLGGINEAKARAAAAGTEAEQAKVQLGMAQGEMKEKETRIKKVETEGQQGKDALERGRKEVAELSAQLGKCGWNREMKEQMDGQMRTAKEAMSQARDKAEQMRNGLSNLDFSYSDPTPGFDRSSVLGYVANLVELTPENTERWSTALEICAGGKLYNVVVRDERVGSMLLKHGQLRKRVTLIPLNKIAPSRTDPQKVAYAKQLAPGKVHLAIDLVRFPAAAKSAMEFVFGDTLICADDETAKKVTYDPKVRMRSVTAHGSLYDPSGTLSGGSAPTGGGILKRVQEVKGFEAKEHEARSAVEKLRAQEESSRGKIETWERLSRELELKTHQIGVLEAQVGGSDSSRLHQEVEELKRNIMQLEATIAGAKERKKGAEAEAAKLEKDMKEFGQNKESKLKELKADIVKKRSDLTKKSAKYKELQKEQQVAQLELEQMEADIEKDEEAVAAAKAAVTESQEQIKGLKAKLDKAEQSRSVVSAKLDQEKAALKAYQNQLDTLAKQINTITEYIAETELKIKTAEHDLANLGKERAALETRVAELEKLNPWFQDEKHNFGKPNGPFDFATMNMQEIKEQARKAEEASKGMKRKVNSKVMHMIEGVEKKDKELQERIAMVQKDKLKIEATIQELDREKMAALEKTWTSVNEQFGQIFAELLPSNFAKLQPPDGKELTDGLEVKVRLGQVWKQSLTELSGGQRSLVALSLIMALLQFKPAPMYILDEIDAALDLSHTQHIGTLFRNRFRGSQFVVVSLKEGLFTNANVLFRTRFRDNTSIVERTAQRSTSAMYADQAQNGRRALITSRKRRFRLKSKVARKRQVVSTPVSRDHDTLMVITQLDTSLLDGLQRQHIHVLSGRSGVGKTQAALQYAKTRKKFFSDIIFVDASTTETIKRSYVSFITSKNRGSTLADSLQWLASSRNNRANWLIIFDGANTVDLEIRGLLPSCAHGNVIVTTRRNNLPSHSEWPRTESRMSGLNHEDAVALLVKVAGGETISCSQSKQTLDRIAQEMHCLPYPLTLAGVYLHRRTCSLGESGRLYCESFEALSTATGPEEYPSKSKSISQVASSVVLRGLSTHATHILGVMAFMEYQNLSEIIFERAAVRLPHYAATLPPTDTEALVEEFLSQLLTPLLTEHGSWNASAFHSLMSELLEYHLLRFDEWPNTFSMSPICRNSILAAQDLDREFLCRVATHLLAVSVDSSMDADYQERVFRQTVAPHVDCVLLQGENISLDDAVRFALVYAANDQLDEAEVLQLEVVEFRRQILGENHPLTLESMDQLEIINRKQGKWREDDDSSSLSDHDSFPGHISYELRRQPRVTRNRISISLHRITATTPLDVVVKYFTLVSRLHDLTSELKPHSAVIASSGGQGNVYQAVLTDNTPVAIKSIRHDWAKLENKVTKYAAREIATWTKLVHPNILELLGLAIFREQLVMVSPWMSCGNVVEFARRHNGNRGSLCLQLSSAVDYMHSLNVIHGDIKGSNVLVSEDGVVKLADFGLTIIQNATLDISITNKGGGTVRWMAPELLMEDSAVRSEPADMYALGMTFLEIYTGHRPYKDTKHDIAVMAMITRREGIKRPEELSPHVTYGDHVWDILQHCWKWNPKERPTASQIKALLYEIV